MEIYFGPTYDKKSHFLLEVNQQVLESLEKIEENNYDFVIKGDTSTYLCTDSKTYEVKLVETSNTFLLLEENTIQSNYKIIMSTDHCLDINEVVPSKYNIVNLLRSSCALSYNLMNGLSNSNGKDYLFRA
jgi:hypothetical protein